MCDNEQPIKFFRQKTLCNSIIFKKVFKNINMIFKNI